MLEVEENLLKWAKSQIPDLGTMERLREQASSRKYYRVSSTGKSFILAFSDPHKELNDEFIKLSCIIIFSFKNSTGYVEFAKIPPTLPAQFIIMSGFTLFIKLLTFKIESKESYFSSIKFSISSI